MSVPNMFGISAQPAVAPCPTTQPAVYTPAVPVAPAPVPAQPAPLNPLAGMMNPLSSDPVSQLQGRIQQGVIPSLTELSNITSTVAANIDPASPQAQQFQARVAGVFANAGGTADLRVQQLFTLNAIKNLDTTLGALKTVAGNLDPASPEAAQLKTRIAGINALRTTLDLQLDRQLKLDPTRGGEIRLPSIPPGTNIGDGSALVGTIQQNIQQGIIPSLDTLKSLQPSGDPGSASAQQLNARVAALLQQAGPTADERIRQFSLTQALRQLDGTTGALGSIMGNLDPGSPEAQQLQARIGAIKAQRDTLTKQLQESVDRDPSHGGAISLNPAGSSVTNADGVPALLLSMMSVMTQLMYRVFGIGQQPQPQR